MNAQDRRIIELIRRKLSFNYVQNPADISGLSRFHNEVRKRMRDIDSYLDEITCFDIPKERIDDIEKELLEAGR